MEFQEINRWKQQYENLPEEQKTIVDLFALKFTGFKKGELDSYIKLCAYTGLFIKDVKSILAELCEKGLVTLQANKYDTDDALKLVLFPKAVVNNKYISVRKAALTEDIISWHISHIHYLKYFLYGSFGFESKFFKESLWHFLTVSEKTLDFWLKALNMPEYDKILTARPDICNAVIRHFRRANILYFNNSEMIMNFYERNPSFKGMNHQTAIHRAEIMFHAGNFTGAEELIKGITNRESFLLKAQIELFRGNYDLSAALFEEARITNEDGYKITRLELQTYHEFFFWLNYIFNPGAVNLKKVDVFIRKSERQYREEYDLLRPLAYIVKKDRMSAEENFTVYKRRFPGGIYANIYAIVILIMYYIIYGKLTAETKDLAEQCCLALAANGQWLLLRELMCMMKQSSMDIPKVHNPLEKNKELSPCLMERLSFQEKWEQVLDGLINVVAQDGDGKAKKTAKATRICYLVDFQHNRIQPILQTLKAGGQWTAGRNIAIKSFKDMKGEAMTDQDMIISTAVRSDSYYYGNTQYFLDFRKALPGLCGHPLLFLMSNPQVPVELVKQQPEIITENTSAGIRITTNVSHCPDQEEVITQETQTRYKLLSLTPQQQNVVRMLDKGLVVPRKGKDKLLAAISKLSNVMTVHSDMAVSSELAETMNADSRIRVQIIPMGNGLKAELFVKPLSSMPPYMKPGKGSKIIHGTIDKKYFQATRDLGAEHANAVKVANSITTDTETDLLEEAIFFDDPYQCLSLLEAVGQNSDIAIAEWPEGESFRLKKSASFANFNLRIKGSGQWFDLDGELNVDENTVLSLSELLQLSKKSKGHFIELEKGVFLALTTELKKQIDELESYAILGKDKVSVNIFAAHALEGLTANAASVKKDKSWKEFQKRLQESSVVEAAVPATFDGEMRPYQEEGFKWMTRLHYWNAGACLADDMGLGKTIQAINMMLTLAQKGPSLVVCPASVLPNWAGELRKFAPALNVVTLKTGNREDIFNSLAPFDVLVITYGLLQTENSRLASRQWTMAVLDEAHAIKNTNTKSSKSAMNIQAEFRLALTGTPIQNHLGELWNLFNFCNPGLLGTLQNFTTRFVNNDSPAQKAHLKKLIAPFILRRTKNNVLDELPPKTEITYRVNLSNEETAFYEALRREAVSNIEKNSGNNGQQHIQALAEITKLRLACCNTKLVNNDIALPSAKLDAFLEIVKELTSGKHRALVFSQFVRHLTIVRAELDKLGITYKYLDGSMSLPYREKTVKEFQAGKGELFLISLKAGGLGLNLTSADYVLHLDPWWNPAIEDQASDRSHRIGQVRPVTIYRLVAANTIEEKIVKLHTTKRDMADSLLEGTDKSAKLSTTDLLNLIKDK